MFQKYNFHTLIFLDCFTKEAFLNEKYKTVVIYMIHDKY